MCRALNASVTVSADLSPWTAGDKASTAGLPNGELMLVPASDSRKLRFLMQQGGQRIPVNGIGSTAKVRLLRKLASKLVR